MLMIMQINGFNLFFFCFLNKLDDEEGSKEEEVVDVGVALLAGTEGRRHVEVNIIQIYG